MQVRVWTFIETRDTQYYYYSILVTLNQCIAEECIEVIE